MWVWISQLEWQRRDTSEEESGEDRLWKRHKSPNTSLTFQFTHENVISDKTKFACRNPGWKRRHLRRGCREKRRLSSHLRHASLCLFRRLLARYARQKKCNKIKNSKLPWQIFFFFVFSSFFFSVYAMNGKWTNDEWRGWGGVAVGGRKSRKSRGMSKWVTEAPGEWGTVTLSANFALELDAAERAFTLHPLAVTQQPPFLPTPPMARVY